MKNQKSKKPKATSGEDVMSVFVNRLKKTYSPDMAARANWQDVAPGSSEEAPLDFDEVVVEDTAPMRAEPREMLMRLQEGAQKPVPSNDYTPAREQIISQMNRSIGMGANRPNMDDIERRLMEIEKGDSASVGDYFTAIAPMVAGTLLGGLAGGAGAGKGTVEALRYDQDRADKKQAAKADVLKGAAKSRIDLYKADQDALMNRFQMLGEIDKRLENLQRGTPEFEQLLKQRQAFAQANIDMMKSLGMSEKDFEEAAFMKNWDLEADLAKQIAAHEQQAKMLEAKGRQEEAAQERLFKQQKELELMRQQGADRRAKMAGSKAAKAKAEKPPTEGERSAALFARVMEAEVPALELLENDPKFLGASMNTMTEKFAPESIANVMRTPEYRQYVIAGKRFLAGVLRKETGAAVTDQEFNFYGPMYLAQPGDDIDTIKQKAQRRREYVNSVYAMGGRASQLVDESLGPPALTKPSSLKYNLSDEQRRRVDEIKEKKRRGIAPEM